MTEHDTLLRNCLEQPDDDTARLVYADWLRERGEPLGRFIWGGVTLSRYRGREPVGEGEFFDAQRELNESAPVVLATQLAQLFGWEWEQVAWDQGLEQPDHVSATLMQRRAASERLANLPDHRRRQPAVSYERGMLTGVRLHSSDWLEYAQRVFAVAPVERVEFYNVAGLVLDIIGPAAGWRMKGTIVIPSGRDRFFDRLVVGGQTARRLEHVEPIGGGSFARVFAEAFLSNTTITVVEALQAAAGDQWPGFSGTGAD